jgi:hypothetical protein
MISNGLSDGEHEGSDMSLRGLYDKRADSVMRDVSSKRSFEQAAEEPEEGDEVFRLIVRGWVRGEERVGGD